jgi:hypothetical protein
MIKLINDFRTFPIVISKDVSCIDSNTGTNETKMTSHVSRPVRERSVL